MRDYEDSIEDVKTLELGIGLRIRSWIANLLLRDVHLSRVYFGEDSVKLTDKINIGATADASAVGDIGRDAGGDVAVWDGAASQKVATRGGTETLANKTLTTPTIGDMSNAGHDHANAAGGAKLSNTALTPGTYSAITGLGAQAIALDMGSQPIVNVANGVNASDAATKGQVDAAKQRLDFKDSVRAVFDRTALAAHTAAGSGVGKTLTANASGALAAQDGVTPAASDRLLVHTPGGSHADDGIYDVTTLGDGLTAWVLTRAVDFDENAEVTAGAEMGVEEGTSFGDKTMRLTTNDPITVDTTALSFQQWGKLIDHGQLIGQADDDHAQYALLAGRAGGQTLQGGTGSGDDLVLQSTTNVTRGDVQVASGDTLRMMGNDTFVPNVTNQGKVGTSTNKFNEVNATTVNSGDHRFEDPFDEENRFNMFESADGHLLLTGLKLGLTWDLGALPSRPATEEELRRAVEGPTV